MFYKKIKPLKKQKFFAILGRLPSSLQTERGRSERRELVRGKCTQNAGLPLRCSDVRVLLRRPTADAVREKNQLSSGARRS